MQKEENYWIPSNEGNNNEKTLEMKLTPEQVEKLKESMTLTHNYKDPIRMKFIVPVGNLSKEEAEKAIVSLIKDYKQEVTFDEVTGEIKMNSKPEDYVVRIVDQKDLYIKPTLWQRFINFFTKKNKK